MRNNASTAMIPISQSVWLNQRGEKGVAAIPGLDNRTPDEIYWNTLPWIKDAV